MEYLCPGALGQDGGQTVNRAMRGEGVPSPICEGKDGVVAWLPTGRASRYRAGTDVCGPAYHQVPLPEPGETRRGILDTCTKEHSAEHQSRALIDLASRMRDRIPDLELIEGVLLHTSHHTHRVIGTGANDPQKVGPDASRGTLDHSVTCIFAVAS